MKWSKQDLEKFMQLYPITNTKDLVPLFNRKVPALRTKAHELGIQKTNETMVNMWSRSNSGQFKRGQTAWNKGTKGLMECNAPTRFKKGQIPHNKLPDNIRAITSQLSRLKKNIKEREKRYATQQN
jgi:hypothetical protein